jgi:hypothetical protein
MIIRFALRSELYNPPMILPGDWVLYSKLIAHNSQLTTYLPASCVMKEYIPPRLEEIPYISLEGVLVV